MKERELFVSWDDSGDLPADNRFRIEMHVSFAYFIDPIVTKQQTLSRATRVVNHRLFLEARGRARFSTDLHLGIPFGVEDPGLVGSLARTCTEMALRHPERRLRITVGDTSILCGGDLDAATLSAKLTILTR